MVVNMCRSEAAFDPSAKLSIGCFDPAGLILPRCEIRSSGRSSLIEVHQVIRRLAFASNGQVERRCLPGQQSDIQLCARCVEQRRLGRELQERAAHDSVQTAIA